MAHILVTGGAGFIGANFVRHWRARHPGDAITVLDLLTYAGNPANLDGVDGVDLIVGDIADTALVEKLLAARGIDTLIHFAAETHVDRSISGPDAFIATNVIGTHSLLKAARKVWLDTGSGRPHRFHHVSTDEVYGSLAPDDPPVLRDDPVRAEFALCGLQGEFGPLRARLSSHLRAADDDQQLLQQLRALPIPREADPAVPPQRSPRKAAADLR